MSNYFDDEVEKKLKENNRLENGKYIEFYEIDLPRMRDHVEELWSRYEKYAPKGFKKNTCRNKESFYQRWWEMYLGCKLLDWGYDDIRINSKEDKGPDFRININNKTYWLEAVAPGLGENENKLPMMQEGVHNLPENEYILRLKNSMDNKIKQFEKYMEDGIVKEEDVKIIAISTCNLSQYDSLMDFPKLAIDKLLYDCGELTINLESGEQWISQKNGINVKSKETKGGIKNIPTNIFKENCIIDGVIYTHDQPLNRYNEFYLRENINSKIGDDFRKYF